MTAAPDRPPLSHPAFAARGRSVGAREGTLAPACQSYSVVPPSPSIPPGRRPSWPSAAIEGQSASGTRARVQSPKMRAPSGGPTPRASRAGRARPRAPLPLSAASCREGCVLPSSAPSRASSAAMRSPWLSVTLWAARQHLIRYRTGVHDGPGVHASPTGQTKTPASCLGFVQGGGVAYGARTRNLRSHNPMLCH